MRFSLERIEAAGCSSALSALSCVFSRSEVVPATARYSPVVFCAGYARSSWTRRASKDQPPDPACYSKTVLSDNIIRVEQLMREIEYGLHDEARRRLLARGGASEYQDPEIFRLVDRLLREAADHPEKYGLLPEFLGAESGWRLQTHLRFISHRPVSGPLVLFVKRWILLPLTRWLYDYTADNFARQERVNRMLVACIEELAIENARLRRDLEHVRSGVRS